MTGTFPLSPLVQPGMDLPADRLQALYWYLPPADKAAALRDVYFTCAAWMYAPIAADEFHEEIYAPFYGMGAPIATADDPRVAHRLSIMFMVFALGSLMDPHQAPFNVEAEKYHQLARAALFQSNIVDDPTISAVQALVRSARSLSAVRRWLTESARAVHDDVLLFPRGPTRRRVGLAVRYHGPRDQARAIGEYFSPLSEPSRSFSRLISSVLLPRLDSVSARFPRLALRGRSAGPGADGRFFFPFCYRRFCSRSRLRTFQPPAAGDAAAAAAVLGAVHVRSLAGAFCPIQPHGSLFACRPSLSPPQGLRPGPSSRSFVLCAAGKPGRPSDRSSTAIHSHSFATPVIYPVC
jgi:hypothetical protein